MADIEAFMAFAREEQVSLWMDFSEALNRAHNGRWSMESAYFARRIIAAARLVGPVRPGEITWTLHGGGVYDTLYSIGRIEAPVTDETEWERLDSQMSQYGGSREQLLARFAGTREAMLEAREAFFINDEIRA
jgi:hypothetical protein